MILPSAPRVSSAFPVLLAALLLPGCALFEGRPDPQTVRAKEKHAAFRAQPGWRKNTYRDGSLVAKAAGENTAVEISLREQRGLLLVDGAIAMDFPLATGRSSHPTPKGSYKILEKKKDYSSNLYGRMVGGDGATLLADADTRDDAVPQGASFVGAPMPYWMRMTPTGLGMHVGHVPGHRPASHGCIRLKREIATELFTMLSVGTPVKVDSFAPTLGGPVGIDSVVIGEVAEKPQKPRSAPRPAPVVSPVPSPDQRANQVVTPADIATSPVVPPASPTPSPEPLLAPASVPGTVAPDPAAAETARTVP